MAFSFGTTYGIKYLSQNKNIINGMVSIANPFDMYKCLNNLENYNNYIYRYF